MEETTSENGANGNASDIPTAHTEKTTRRSYKQIYRKDWENNPLFQGWLSSVPCDKHKAECTACKKELLAHRLTLLKHASSAKHLKKVSMGSNSLATETQSTDLPIIENSNSTEQNTVKEFQINGTSTSNNVQNTIDIFPQLINLNNVNPVQFTEPKMTNIDKAFAEEMEAQLSQMTADEVATSTISLERNDRANDTSSGPGSVPDIIIQTDSFVGMTDTPEAINFKQGYVAKSKTPQTIICAASFIDTKIDQAGSTRVIDKLTTYPLQISTRVTDYSRGISAVNLSITLYMLTGGKWVSVGQSVTDAVGRCNLFHKDDTFFSIGLYKLHYDTATYYDQENLKSYFPFIEIVFQMKSLHETHHIPLMISPNGYTAYKSMDY